MSIIPLSIPRWDHYSTWGEEGGLSDCLYAQLYRNDDDGLAEPRIWITPPHHIIQDVDELATAIASALQPYFSEVNIELVKKWMSADLELEEYPNLARSFRKTNHSATRPVSMPSPSRNRDSQPGRAITDLVALRDWEARSVWGWDSSTHSFYAQLWRNNSTHKTPEIWLTTDSRKYPWPSCIALGIVEQTGREPAEVVAALGLADPAPQLVPDSEVVHLLQSAVDQPKSELTHGAIHALGWAQGYASVTPSMRQPWTGPRPTAVQVDAEHHLATGYLYRPGSNRDFISGVDIALWWLLGRSSDTWFLQP